MTNVFDFLLVLMDRFISSLVQNFDGLYYQDIHIHVLFLVYDLNAT